MDVDSLSGNAIPGIGYVERLTSCLFHCPLFNPLYLRFGTWKIPTGHTTVDQVDQAISVGFSHVGEQTKEDLTHAFQLIQIPPDTAQAYRNEQEAGKAIKESGLSRDEIFITTKYSGLNGLNIEESIRNSLQNVS